MPKYRITVREDAWHTYEIETDLTKATAISDLFYEMTEEQQKGALVETDSLIEIEEIELISEEAA